MRILSVVGARPQFIKSAPVSKEIRSRSMEEILVHTGQHYDDDMSAAFFRELSIPEPDINLGVGSGSHGKQTAKMIEGLEQAILDKDPDGVLVYGDTNSTVAGALTAAKLHVPVAHVEAGLRSFNRRMPEELNRVVADHLSDILFTPTPTAVSNLQKEGLGDKSRLVGDTMADLLMSLDLSKSRDIPNGYGLEPGEYYLATVHRAENTDDPTRLKNIIDALAGADMPVVFPAHPRTRKLLEEREGGSIRIESPVGYSCFISLLANSRALLTDSGGAQKEAYILGVPCITLRDETEWVETVDAGWNILTGASREEITDAMKWFHPKGERKPLFGDGKASERIADILEETWG